MITSHRAEEIKPCNNQPSRCLLFVTCVSIVSHDLYPCPWLVILLLCALHFPYVPIPTKESAWFSSQSQHYATVLTQTCQSANPRVTSASCMRVTRVWIFRNFPDSRLASDADSRLWGPGDVRSNRFKGFEQVRKSLIMRRENNINENHRRTE